MNLDVKIAQLLNSRLCHDLVGSASAINAGLELIREDPNDTEGPLDLMTKSAAQITRRLAFFRVAFGLAEGANGAATVEETRHLATGLLGGSKVSLIWKDTDVDDASRALPTAFSKVCLNLVLAASECLPRGGEIGLRLISVSSGDGIAIEAKGQGARISDDMSAALIPNTDLAFINAHNVHVFYAQMLARDCGAEIECQSGTNSDSIQIAVVFPKV
jgi:histidine phosphotransferase ChpT